MHKSHTIISVIHDTDAKGNAGWVAMILGTVPTTVTVGLRPTAEEVVEIVERMRSARMVATDAIVEVMR